MAYIRQIGKRWRADVERNGQRLSKTLPTKREAQAWALQQEAHAVQSATGWRTVGAAADQYLRTITTLKRSQKWENR
jgi:hypothetical protein